jgi:hypothetical protein
MPASADMTSRRSCRNSLYTACAGCA